MSTPNMAEIITVMAAKQDDRVVLWERHPDHPGGEVFVAGNGRAVRAARTAAVQQRLAVRTLLVVQPATDAPASKGKKRS